MVMTMNKIISVDKPNGKKSRWNIYIIHYEDKNGEKYDAHVFEEEYNVIIFKRRLVEMGVPEVDLDRYEKLLYGQWDRERSLEKA